VPQERQWTGRCPGRCFVAVTALIPLGEAYELAGAWREDGADYKFEATLEPVE